ncbi:hypothetical protein CDO73_05795 [Saccharibacillus sp. O23]|uniref:S-layer homology domain-containing protein n=1 Tax=Saccharibacillus sp. O23 TaxID=2009338 RepID=UPI000B4E24D1|nr:S-layer homology domain-containing protein [Saccharibacillus sp. O23]OWR31984.1 hypothetical protein CDO73_05795 [Saccharibacillus sp. O23]
MNRQKKYLTKALNVVLCSVLTCSLWAGTLPVSKASANAAAPILVNVNNNQMDFSTLAKVSGTDKAQGAVYRYSNVLQSSNVNVDALVSITNLNNLSINELDVPDANSAQLNKRFNPKLTTSNGDGSADYKVDFVVSGTNDPVALYNFYTTIIDIDGSSSTQREFAQLGGYTRYTKDQTSGLTISSSPDTGRTEFKGITTNLNDVSFDNTASVIASYEAPVSSIAVTLGIKGTLSQRLFSVNFGAPGGTFTTPVVQPNPQSPTISASIADNEGKLSPEDATIDLSKVAISGTTGAEPGQTVNLVVTDSSGATHTYTALVQSDKKYATEIDVTSFPAGTLSVSASVVNQLGNPSVPYKDQSTLLKHLNTPMPSVNGTTVSWAAVPNADHYSVQVKDQDGKTVFGPNNNGTSTSFDVSTLNGNSGSYTVSVLAAGITPYLNSEWTPGQSVTYTSPLDPKAEPVVETAPQYAPLQFSAYDFQSSFGKLNGSPNGDNLSAIRIDSLPDASAGSLTLNDIAVTAGQEIKLADIGKLRFVPAAEGFSGSAQFAWNGKDGTKYAASASNVTLNANHAPVLSPIVKETPKNVDVTFKNSEFEDDAYSDADGPMASMSAVRIESLPETGKLMHGSREVEVGDTIDGNDLARLTYVWQPGVTEASFTWNATDGYEYAKVASTVKMTVNLPPEAGTVHRDALSGAKVPFGLGDFNAFYTDAEGDALHHIIVNLPADFASQGQLSYGPAGSETVLTPGTLNNVPASALNELVFAPNPELQNGSTVTFPWTANDGKQNSETDGKVEIAFNGIPSAASKLVDVEEDATSVPIVLKGTDKETAEGLLTYQIVNQPTRGTLQPQDGDASGSLYTYVPNGNFLGTDSFDFIVTDEAGQVSQSAKFTIRFNKTLNGWVGETEGSTSTVYAVPGQALKLNAKTSLLAQSATATVDGDVVQLTLANVDTYAADGYKLWEKTNYMLPVDAGKGEHTVSFDSKGAEDSPLPGEKNLTDNVFKIAVYKMALTANPAKIIGDGISTTELKAVLTDEQGQPVVDSEVIFSVPSGEGTFVGSDRVRTDSSGVAKKTYRSAKITSNQEQQVDVWAETLDVAKGIHAKEKITVTFQPATISGVVTQGADNRKVAGASVRITLDLDGDHVITPGVDFDETVVTDENGAYSIAVPEGGRTYTIEVMQTILIGGTPKQISYKQTAEVGQTNGTNPENYNSTKTATGIVLQKQPDGGTGVLSADMAAKTKVYLKNAATGEYVQEGGHRKAFPAQNDGVFSAEGLSLGSYTMEVVYEVRANEELVIQRNEVNVAADGEMNISETLVDPYGDITDGTNGAAVEGAQVTLYYANTARNGSKGGTTVTLPAIPGFAPNDNASPVQMSDAAGFYAYMVYPHTDYYLVVSKNGYQTYTSPTIPVETDIVRHNVSLQRVSASPAPTPVTTGTPAPAPAVDLKPSVSIKPDRNLVEEGSTSTIVVDYKQNGSSTLTGGTLTVKLPAGVEVTDANGGKVENGTVTWTVEALASGQSGSRKLQVKWPQLAQAEQGMELTASFASGSLQAATASSNAKIQVYSGRFGSLEHKRYILGYPDLQFKPTHNLTRAELAAITARLTENVSANGGVSYKDVPKTHWAADYIAIATAQGYFSGYSDGTFRPEAPVTRAELAAVMAKFLDLSSALGADGHFSDIQGHWAAAAIEQLYDGHFLNGYVDSTFRPNNRITRAEAVTMINRMLFRGPLTGLDVQFPDVPANYWAFGDVQEATQSHESTRTADGEVWVRTLQGEMR